MHVCVVYEHFFNKFIYVNFKVTYYHELCTIMKLKMRSIVNMIFSLSPRPNLYLYFR